MCKELCENDDVGPQSCPDCGRLICFDTTGFDDIMAPAYVTESGDLFCDRCGRAHDRAEEEFDGEDDDVDEFDEDDWEDAIPHDVEE